MFPEIVSWIAPPFEERARAARRIANAARRGSGRRRPRPMPLEANGRLFA
jgi:hypothetical protein